MVINDNKGLGDINENLIQKYSRGIHIGIRAIGAVGILGVIGATTYSYLNNEYY